MASYSVARIKHATLTTDTVDTVTIALTGVWNATLIPVEVFNRGTSDPVSFTTDGTAPTALGDDCYVVPAGYALKVDVPVLSSAASVVVKLIAPSAVAYSVTEAS